MNHQLIMLIGEIIKSNYCKIESQFISNPIMKVRQAGEKEHFGIL